MRVYRVHKYDLLVVCGNTMFADLLELPMNDFHIILGMDWLHKCYDFINCCSRVVTFRFLNEVMLVWEGYNLSRSSPMISNLRANKMMSKRLLCHLVGVNDLDHDIPSIDSVPVVNEFQAFFPDDFPWIPQPQEIDFGIDLDPDAKPIPIPPYRMTPADSKSWSCS